MTYYYYHPDFVKHETGQHPEQPPRASRIHQAIVKEGLDKKCQVVDVSQATDTQLTRVHPQTYVDKVETFATKGGGRIESDTVVSRDSFRVARLASGAVCDAVAKVLAAKKEEQKSALCVVRPPGHHALPQRPMGFCLFNNVAVGALAAIEKWKLERILIIDWDVHHGNGTQDIFYEDGRVGFFSIHRWPFYPGTGAASETGKGKGLGTTLNLPVEYGTKAKDFHAVFEKGVTELARKIKPQLILISAGFDAHRDDPIGSLGLSTEDFPKLTKFVQGLAGEYCDGKLVSILEGGYDLDALSASVVEHLRVLVTKQD